MVIVTVVSSQIRQCCAIRAGRRKRYAVFSGKLFRVNSMLSDAEIREVSGDTRPKCHVWSDANALKRSVPESFTLKH